MYNGEEPAAKSSHGKKKSLFEEVNPFNRRYVIAILFEDYLEIKKLKNTHVDVEGFIFNKVISIVTRYPFYRYYSEILSSLLDILKVTRSTEISSKLALGLSLEEIDLSEFDSELSTHCLIESYKDLIGELPHSTELHFDRDIKFGNGLSVPIVYRIPEEKFSHTIECRTLGKEFLKEIRFEELWVCLNIILNEKKLILVSSDTSILGAAM